MRSTWKLLTLVALAVAVAVLAAGAAFAGGPPGKERVACGRAVASATPAVTPLIDGEAAELTFMREEEKLARDVYTVLYDMWGLRAFDSIATSEVRHTDAVKMLLDRYGLDDPMADDIPGRFVDQELQTLYEGLVDRGSVSLVDALEVGVDIEKLDIEDLETLLADTTHPDITRVVQNLLAASDTHLATFTGLLEK